MLVLMGHFMHFSGSEVVEFNVDAASVEVDLPVLASIFAIVAAASCTVVAEGSSAVLEPSADLEPSLLAVLVGPFIVRLDQLVVSDCFVVVASSASVSIAFAASELDQIYFD